MRPHGTDAVELTYKTAGGERGQRVLGRDIEGNLAIVDVEARPFDAVAAALAGGAPLVDQREQLRVYAFAQRGRRFWRRRWRRTGAS